MLDSYYWINFGLHNEEIDKAVETSRTTDCTNSCGIFDVTFFEHKKNKIVKSIRVSGPNNISAKKCVLCVDIIFTGVY